MAKSKPKPKPKPKSKKPAEEEEGSFLSDALGAIDDLLEGRIFEGEDKPEAPAAEEPDDGDEDDDEDEDEPADAGRRAGPGQQSLTIEHLFKPFLGDGPPALAPGKKEDPPK